MASCLPSDELNNDEKRSFENYKGLLLSLPKEKGWISKHMYQYQGYWYHKNHGLGVMAVQQHFKARATDILLVSTPKAGTIWFKAIVFAIMNRNQYLISNHPLLTINAHNCVPFLELQLFRQPPFVDVEGTPSPRLFGTHIPLRSLPNSVIDSDCRMIYICRNPKDVLVSMWHFVSNLRDKDLTPLSLDEAFELFCEGKSLYGPFWDHIKEYKEASVERPDRVLFVTYEEMKRDSVACTKRLAEFLGCPFSLEEEENGYVEEMITLCSFGNMSKLEVNKTMKSGYGDDATFKFLRQGKVGDFKNHLSTEMIKLLDKMTDEKLNGIFPPCIPGPNR